MKYLKVIGAGLGFIIFNWSPFGKEGAVSPNMSILICIIFIACGFMVGKLLEDKNK